MQGHFQRYLWTNIGIVVGSIAVFSVVFYFLSQALSDTAGRILADRAIIAQRTANLESLNDLKTNAATAAVIQKKIDPLLPTQDGLISFPQFMNNLGRTHSLNLIFNFDGAAVSPQPPTPGYVAFDATVEGSPDNIRSFLADLEEHTTRFLVNVQEFDFTPSSGGVYRGDLKGQVFFRENDAST